MFKALWAEAKCYSCGMQGKMANLLMASFFLSFSCYVKIWIRTHVYTRACFFFFFSVNVQRNQEMWNQMCCWLSFRVPRIVIFFHGNRPALTWIFSGISISWKEQISSCLSCVFVHCLWNGLWWSCAPFLALGKWWRKGSLISVPTAFSMFWFTPHLTVPCSLVDALMFLLG